MRTGMNIMVDDIRRAGYWGAFVQGTDNPFTVRTGALITDIYILSFNGVSNACILYSYDATYQDHNHIGTPIGDRTSDLGSEKGADFFGFRLGTNGTLQMRHGGTTTNDCTDGNWESITDENTLVIEALTFDTEESQCMNSTGVVDATTGQRVPVDWRVTTPNTAIPACEDTTATDYQAPNDDDHLVELRQINILMRARHQNDASLRAELSESVKVRNDRVFTFVAPGP
jgi:type IV pilus assembly protein PilW